MPSLVKIEPGQPWHDTLTKDEAREVHDLETSIEALFKARAVLVKRYGRIKSRAMKRLIVKAGGMA